MTDDREVYVAQLLAAIRNTLRVYEGGVICPDELVFQLERLTAGYKAEKPRVVCEKPRTNFERAEKALVDALVIEAPPAKFALPNEAANTILAVRDAIREARADAFLAAAKWLDDEAPNWQACSHAVSYCANRIRALAEKERST